MSIATGTGMKAALPATMSQRQTSRLLPVSRGMKLEIINILFINDLVEVT